jgi:hypothetical protein
MKHQQPAHFFVFLLIFVTLLVLFFLLPPAHAQESCPDGYKCIPEEKAADIVDVIEHRQCMEEALEKRDERFSYDIQPFTLIVTEKGQVFVDGSITSTLTWCNYELEFESDPQYSVNVRNEEPGIDWSFEFRPRVRLGLLFHPIDIATADSYREVFEPALLFEPFHVGLFHPEVHIGLKSFGLGPALDVTRNLDFYMGVASRWRDLLPLTYTTGFSLSFN